MDVQYILSGFRIAKARTVVCFSYNIPQSTNSIQRFSEIISWNQNIDV